MPPMMMSPSMTRRLPAFIAVAEAFGYSREQLASIPAEANMGLSCGNPTAFAGLKQAVQQNLVRSDETIVCLITGSGLKDIASAMKVAGSGTRIEPTLDAVRNLKIIKEF